MNFFLQNANSGHSRPNWQLGQVLIALTAIKTWSGALDLWSFVFTRIPWRRKSGAETSMGDTYHESCFMMRILLRVFAYQSEMSTRIISWG